MSYTLPLDCTLPWQENFSMTRGFIFFGPSDYHESNIAFKKLINKINSLQLNQAVVAVLNLHLIIE